MQLDAAAKWPDIPSEINIKFTKARVYQVNCV